MLARQDMPDLEALAGWMSARDGVDAPCLNPCRLEAGTQNRMVAFERGGSRYVFRQPPAHALYPGDRLVARETRILRGLEGSRVPHPAVFADCLRGDAFGGPFYVMSAVEGFTPTGGLPERFRRDPGLQRHMGFSCVDTLHRLAGFDAAAAGLDDLGRPEGFLERQVERWRTQLLSYARFEGWRLEGDLLHLDDIGRWLSDYRPETVSSGLIHGDCHLGNLMFDRDDGAVAAMVDWELATLGDHLVDFGWLLATWPAPDGRDTGSGIAIPGASHLPMPAELIERYEAVSGRPLRRIKWYVVLACYKLGIIQEGSWARALAGKVDRETGRLQHERALAMIAKARTLVRKGAEADPWAGDA